MNGAAPYWLYVNISSGMAFMPPGNELNELISNE